MNEDVFGGRLFLLYMMAWRWVLATPSLASARFLLASARFIVADPAAAAPLQLATDPAYLLSRQGLHPSMLLLYLHSYNDDNNKLLSSAFARLNECPPSGEASAAI